MSIKFYLATGLVRIEEAKVECAKLRERGWIQTYDWTKHGSLQTTPDQWPIVSDKELQGVIDADVVIALLPGDRGTHTEFGAALASCKVQPAKKIFLVYQDHNVLMGADGYVCIFYNHPFVTHVKSVDEAIALSEK